MAVAKKDDNNSPTLLGISCVDGVTPIRVTINPSNGRMLVDPDTVISVVPTNLTSQDNNAFPITKGVSSTDENIVLPWYVNPINGAVLIDP